jgi:GNAT superfamily N-acetyltransferase
MPKMRWPAGRNLRGHQKKACRRSRRNSIRPNRQSAKSKFFENNRRPHANRMAGITDQGSIMAMVIKPARTAADIRDATKLAWSFIALLKERYPERIQSLNDYLRDQRFEEMLANFRDHFNPPSGECVIARLDGSAVGIVMLKSVNASLCEMNRMYVAPEARGRGIGRALCQALISRALDLGYQEMRLGALDRHVEALPLYRSLGFMPDPDPPAHARDDPGVISLRMTLNPEATRT